MTVDNFGHGFPILHAFVKNEESSHLQAILESFLRKHDNVQNVYVFVIRKDFKEISALGTVYPNARINLCYFHVSQAVSRHLKIFSNHALARKVRDLFMQQVTTESLEEYEEIKPG